MGKKLRVLAERDEVSNVALQAPWPEPVLTLSEAERHARVRSGTDTVILTEHLGDKSITRGFVRAVLRVPLRHPRGAVYGVFIEVDKAEYQKLKAAFSTQQPTRVWGRLAMGLKSR
jgi:hypothetical protein